MIVNDHCLKFRGLPRTVGYQLLTKTEGRETPKADKPEGMLLQVPNSVDLWRCSQEASRIISVFGCFFIVLLRSYRTDISFPIIFLQFSYSFSQDPIGSIWIDMIDCNHLRGESATTVLTQQWPLADPSWWSYSLLSGGLWWLTSGDANDFKKVIIVAND